MKRRRRENPLAALEARLRDYGPGLPARKLGALAKLGRADLATAREVERLHECLVFLRAYPDSREVEACAARMLEAFAARRDLRRASPRLVDSGIAGTEIRFRFFSAMARWLAERWPDRLQVDWKAFENADRLETFLPLLAAGAEQPGLDEYDLGLHGWLDAMRGDDGEAAFLVRRFHALAASDAVIETLWDELDPPLRLLPDPGRTPDRTRSHHPRAPRALQRRPLSRGRPDLREALAVAPRRVRACSLAEGRTLVDLSREAMLTRSRDLDAFSYGDPRDVRLVDWGDGLAFACIGVVPERRLLLEAVYGFLTLRNGVPIGYVLNSALYGSAELAYNVFDTFRGAEAGVVYAKVLAMVGHLFGAETYTIYPYQLGDGNDEAIESGAWWFYRKFGFAPRHAGTRRLVRAEEARMQRRPSHRSSAATLRALARENLYWSRGPERDDVIGELPLASVGLAATRFLAANWGADRGRAERECALEAGGRLGLADAMRAGEAGVAAPRGWNASEREAWRRWAPLVCMLPGLERWTVGERAALAAVIRAKGGRRESDFVRAFDAHAPLREAVRAIAVRTKT